MLRVVDKGNEVTMASEIKLFIWVISWDERFTARGTSQQDAFTKLPDELRARVPHAEFCTEIPNEGWNTASLEGLRGLAKGLLSVDAIKAYYAKTAGKKLQAAEFAELWKLADEAGLKAAEPVLDNDAVGFVWINFPANTAFGRWAKTGIERADKHCHGGLAVYSRVPKQGMNANEAWAYTVRQVLRGAGIEVHVGSRMD